MVYRHPHPQLRKQIYSSWFSHGSLVTLTKDGSQR